MRNTNFINDAIDEITNNFEHLKKSADIIETISEEWISAIEKGNKIIFCGNGGSAADSQHLAAELMGKYKVTRNPMPSISLTTNTSAITAIANDYSYDKVFARQLNGLAQKGDVLIGLSTSGNSKNVIEAFKTAKMIGVKTIAFTGKNGGELKNVADINLSAPTSITNNIQELHISVGHIICDIVESHFFKQ